MARILVVTWAGGGNVPPAVTLATQLAARGHDVRAHRHRVAGRPVRRPTASRSCARDVLTEWDPAALARDVLAEARKVDLVVADYMLPAALSAAEAAGVPVVALVHTLYAANLDGSGGLHPMGMASSIDIARHGPSRARRAAGRRASASCSTGAPACWSPARSRSTCPSPDRPDHVRYVGPLLEPPGPDAGWRPPGRRRRAAARGRRARHHADGRAPGAAAGGHRARRGARARHRHPRRPPRPGRTSTAPAACS